MGKHPVRCLTRCRYGKARVKYTVIDLNPLRPLGRTLQNRDLDLNKHWPQPLLGHCVFKLRTSIRVIATLSSRTYHHVFNTQATQGARQGRSYIVWPYHKSGRNCKGASWHQGSHLCYGGLQPPGYDSGTFIPILHRRTSESPLSSAARQTIKITNTSGWFCFVYATTP